MSASPRRRGLGERGLTELNRQLSPRDVAVLDSVAAHRFMTARQLQALLFHDHATAASGARVCHRALARLARDGLLVRPERRVGGLGAGSGAAIWRLSPSGVRLRRLRAGEGTAWLSGYVEPGSRFIQHYLAVGDCHVALVQAERQRRLELLDLQLEPDCWRRYTGLGGGRLVLKPDLYVVTAPIDDGHTPADFEDHWFIEIDLGTPRACGSSSSSASSTTPTDGKASSRRRPAPSRWSCGSYPATNALPSCKQPCALLVVSTATSSGSRPPRTSSPSSPEARHERPCESVDMVLTSPPYFRLRNYDVEGQLGLEGHVDAWVGSLYAVLAEVQRVLVPTGSCWLNLGDSYSTHTRQGAAKKSLLLGPERLALRLVADGWIVRNKLIWAKANPMPSSVRDRLTATHEYIYVLTRQPSSFFDLDAIRTAHVSRPTKVKPGAARSQPREAWRGPNGDDGSGLTYLKARGLVGHPLGKNPGDVWRFASSNYRGGHHATFPLALAERAIRAGCPEARCAACRTPWRRATIRALGGTAVRGTLGPTCGCDAVSEPGVVLDPFFGAGTSGVAAEALGRDWLGIELNPEFAGLAERRIAAARANLRTAA